MTNGRNGLKAGRKWLGGMLVVGILVAGCGEPGGPEGSGDSVDVTKSAFSSGGYAVWQVTGSSTLDLGPASNQTCFLAGVVGKLAVGPGTTLRTNSVGVRMNTGGNFELFITEGTPGVQLGAVVGCASSVAGRTQEFTWSRGQAPVSMGPVTAGRECFLTRVSSTAGAGAGGAFTLSTDNVGVTNDGTTWTLDGSLTGTGSATARCIDRDPSYVLGYDNSVADGASASFPAATNTGSDMCFLTRLQGHFTASDWTDGVQIRYNAPQFFLYEKNGKRAALSCVR